jgi:hypothetical protein
MERGPSGGKRFALGSKQAPSDYTGIRDPALVLGRRLCHRCNQKASDMVNSSFIECTDPACPTCRNPRVHVPTAPLTCESCVYKLTGQKFGNQLFRAPVDPNQPLCRAQKEWRSFSCMGECDPECNCREKRKRRAPGESRVRAWALLRCSLAQPSFTPRTPRAPLAHPLAHPLHTRLHALHALARVITRLLKS